MGWVCKSVCKVIIGYVLEISLSPLFVFWRRKKDLFEYFRSSFTLHLWYLPFYCLHSRTNIFFVHGSTPGPEVLCLPCIITCCLLLHAELPNRVDFQLFQFEIWDFHWRFLLQNTDFEMSRSCVVLIWGNQNFMTKYIFSVLSSLKYSDQWKLAAVCVMIVSCVLFCMLLHVSIFQHYDSSFLLFIYFICFSIVLHLLL